jgi:hypothetical protein
MPAHHSWLAKQKFGKHDESRFAYDKSYASHWGQMAIKTASGQWELGKEQNSQLHAQANGDVKMQESGF